MKRILLSTLAILVAIGLMGGGVFAYFSDTETSEGATFTTGIFDLKIRNQPGPWQDEVSATWTLTDMEPGETALGEVELHIDSASIAADHLEITCDYTVSGFTPKFADDMAKQMIITLMRYSKGAKQVNLLNTDGYDKGYEDPGEIENGPQVDDYDEDGKLSLYDLKHGQGGNGIDDLLPPYGVWHFEMAIQFDGDDGDQFQGKTLELTMMFTLNQ